MTDEGWRRPRGPRDCYRERAAARAAEGALGLDRPAASGSRWRENAARQVNVWNGDNYAWELVGALGLRESGGAVRAGLVHYNDQADVDRLLAAVAELA